MLKTCTQYEYLGVILDSQINLIKTISKTVSTASNRCMMLCKLRSKMSKRTALLVYKQTIMPVLEYCGFLYNGITKLQHKRLQHVQNRCLRVCLKVRLKCHIENLHHDAAIDYLCIRFDAQLLALLHKYLYGGKHNAAALGLRFETANPNARRTRSTNTGLLAYPPCIKKGYMKSPLYRGIELWNSLEPSSRKSDNLDAFKTKVLPELRVLLRNKKQL